MHCTKISIIVDESQKITLLLMRFVPAQAYRMRVFEAFANEWHQVQADRHVAVSYGMGELCPVLLQRVIELAGANVDQAHGLVILEPM